MVAASKHCQAVWMPPGIHELPRWSKDGDCVMRVRHRRRLSQPCVAGLHFRKIIFDKRVARALGVCGALVVRAFRGSKPTNTRQK